MNSITFKTTLLKGDTGAGIDKTIPEDGVIYYDGDTAPEGYTQTTDPTGGGGGSSYEETTLYYNSSGAPTSGNITLEDDYTNYNTLIFCIHSLTENNIVTFAYIPTSELNTTVGNYSASTRMTSANMDLQFKVVDSKTLTLSIPNNATKLIKIIGVKY